MMEVRLQHQNVQQFDWHEVFVPNDVRDAGFVQIQGSIRRANGQHINDIASGVSRIPVARVFVESDFVIQSPDDKVERAAHGQRSLVKPMVAVFLNRLSRDNRQHRQATKIEEKCERMLQFDPYAARVQRLNTELRWVFNFAAVVILRILDVKELAGIIGGGRWVQRAPPRIDYVVGRYRLTGGPD